MNANKFNWVSNDDASNLLNVSKRQLYEYRKRNMLPYAQIGRKIFYKVSDLNQLLTKNYTDEYE